MRTRPTVPLLASLMLLAALSHASVAAIRLDSLPLDRSVPVSVDPAQGWSWAGVPQGRWEALGLDLTLPTAEADGRTVLVSTGPCAAPEGAAAVWALFSPVGEPALASVAFEVAGQPATIEATEACLAWLGPEPANRRLLLARCWAEGIHSVSVSGAYLWAVFASDAEAAADRTVNDALAEAADAWRERLTREVSAARLLQDAAARLEHGRVAFLPPVGVVPPAVSRVLLEAGLARKLGRLQPTDLLDPQRFSAARVPVVLYAGDERYLRSLYRPDDVADAIGGYLREGGAIVLLSAGPYPMYYAVDAWSPIPVPGDCLLTRLGIVGTGGFEKPPEGGGTYIHPVEGQTLLPSVDGDRPFPTVGDQRLRTLGAAPGSDVTMTPLLEVRYGDGRSAGHCAALFTLGGGEHPGRILYVWCGLTADPRFADGILADVVRLIVEQAGGEGSDAR